MPAIAIPLIISAGASIAKAKMASNAAKKAAQTQETAGERALGFQTQAYQQQRADVAPYAQAGQASLANLTAMGQQPVVSRGPNGYQPTRTPAPAPMPAASPMTLNQIGPASGARPRGPMSPMSPDGGDGPMVQLRAPDGSVQAVPATVAPHYLARGAVRV